MNYTLNDLKHLEVMAGLANAETIEPIKYNFLDLTSKNKKQNLDDKILSLCSKLRDEGFEKQAGLLEDKFLYFKTASTHLYRAIDEDGEDLIDAAHPDGDVTMAEASDDLGDVETTVSLHKKIVDMINKNPIGKLASPTDGEQVATVVQKFEYLSEYIKKHFLGNVPEGSTLNPKDRNFYGLAYGWFELASTIVNELGNVGNQSISSVMQMIKNKLSASAFGSSYSHIMTTPSDVDRLVNSMLNWFEDNRPVAKSGALIPYINKCLTVLSQISKEDNEKLDSENSDSFIKEFKLFADNFSKVVQENITKEIGPGKKYFNIKLPNGKKVSDYFSQGSLDSNFNGIDQLPVHFQTLVSRWIYEPDRISEWIGDADFCVKKVIDLIKQIDLAIDNGNTGFDNIRYPERIFSSLNPYTSIFMSLYSKVHGDQTASKWHGQFFAFEILNNKIAETNQALTPVLTRIERHIISSEELQKNNIKLYNWFLEEKKYIIDIKNNLNKLVSMVAQYFDTLKKTDLSKVGLVDINMLKNFADKIDKNLVADLNFTSKELFFKSLNDLSLNFMKDCFDSIDKATINDIDLRSRLLSSFKPVKAE